MSGDLFRPVIDPRVMDACRTQTIEWLAAYPLETRPALVAHFLGVYAQAAVETVGREEAGALIRGAAADAGAVLPIVRQKPRASKAQRILEWFVCFVAAWLLFDIVRVASTLAAAWLRGGL